MEVQRVAMAVAQQVDLGGEAAAGTPQGVIRGLLGIVALAAPAGASRGADHGAVDAPQLAVHFARIHRPGSLCKKIPRQAGEREAHDERPTGLQQIASRDEIRLHDYTCDAR